MKLWLILAVVSVLLTGCGTTHSVIVNTDTVLGISVAENPGTGLYEARLGYARSEFAYVPTALATNMQTGVVTAQFVPNVIMEIRMENLFRGGLVYQRLVVGDNAVGQQAATLLLGKSPDGKLDPQVLKLIK